jgi:EAL domain-containing protein (putative c-di-GMP-specific phosphodiesterase class I)/ActR/RegA family two-component response regulator
MTAATITKLLILDDDTDYRMLLLTRLGNLLEGVELVEYDPLKQGFPDKEFDWSPYDVLLLDYNLNIQDKTGLDLIQANRKNPQFPATIMLTGAGSEEIAVRALKAGVDDYLRKENLIGEQLHKAIIEAFDNHKKEQERQNELTSHSHAFNKALFYQQLEKPAAKQDGNNRVLLLICLDNHQLIEELAGLIMRDNIIRHIAKLSFAVFRQGNSHPSITRLSDVSVALLVDDPGQKNLEHNLEDLCDHLGKNPYEYEGRKIDYTVSIGAVELAGPKGQAEAIIQDVRAAALQAEQLEGNSYHISGAGQPAPEPAGSVATAGAGTSVTKLEPAPTPQAPASAEQEKPADQPPIAAKKPTPVSKEEAELGLKIKKGFDEKRAVLMFQPVIPLFSTDEEGADTREFHYLSMQMLDTDGTILGEEALRKGTQAPAIRKFIDRWMLRETIGRVVNNEAGRYLFIVRLSQASLADSTLFNWLRNLLAAVEARQPGKSMALEIAADDYAALQKPAGALMSYLKKSHGFKFVLGDINKEHDINKLTDKTSFALLRLDQSILAEAGSGSAGGNEGGAETISLKSKGLKIIADGVEDATSLTSVIASGADYAMGSFLGEAVDQLEDITNVESFEIV